MLNIIPTFRSNEIMQMNHFKTAIKMSNFTKICGRYQSYSHKLRFAMQNWKHCFHFVTHIFRYLVCIRSSLLDFSDYYYESNAIGMFRMATKFISIERYEWMSTDWMSNEWIHSSRSYCFFLSFFDSLEQLW